MLKHLVCGNRERNNMIYIPPPYRPHLLPRAVAWTLLAIGSVLFVVVCVLLMWVVSGFVN